MTALGVSLLRGAVTSPFKRAGGPGATLPTGRAVLPAAPTAPAPLAAYRTLCGFTDPETLPLTYPHVLGFPLAMRLMTERSFPLPVLGLVHTWIEITAHRPPRPEDRLELRVHAAELTPHRRGTEVTMVTEARCAGETVWESRSGYLSRHAASGAAGGTAARSRGATAPPDAPAAGAGLPAVAEWRLPGDLGRRYGAVSGDRNPIHLHPLTARLFGFPRHLAHGMWTVARCLAEAETGAGPGTGTGAGPGTGTGTMPGTGTGAGAGTDTGAKDRARIRSVRAEFKAPVLLPATVTYAAAGDAFLLRGGDRVHLTGTVVRER
ncbi:MaoC/PaaZ C-terminal domain-containing protein [Streptomyces sp. NTK 937]|uniref:MaoC/PaaZ C-terminal domain-containing protein n=1 Tax=Streptomyces sp. NTK 937 TaxID=1487711 RepID=UPI0004A97EE7|nr:MaoC/PaaZ C-terminal domain-containing protein [Streptomyces sp. NTK 937]KDQ67891.1 dehydratase [Streptomyces sp. NTK 937]